MPEAIVIREHGEPAVLRLEAVDVAAPGQGQIRLRQTAIGVNFHDVYVRSGAYRTLQLPGVPGLEGVGVVEALGADVGGFAVGDRVAYLDSGYGAYATERLVKAAMAVRLPPGIDDQLAATVMLKGVTATILALQVHAVSADETVLIHAAAGGVGRLLAQWSAHLGARVIGTVGSEEKVQIAHDHGCAEVIRYDQMDFAERVMELTGGQGAAVVYDGVGRDTFNESLKALAIRGHLVVYGRSSGAVPAFDIARLGARSSTISRPSYAHYIETPEELRRVAGQLFDALVAGVLKPERGRSFTLSDAGRAHAALEARVPGPLTLTP